MPTEPVSSIHDILAEFREEALNNRELGDKFERLICRYLELDPQYADQFSNVWMWNEWPQKGAMGDIGIDIVAEDAATGEFCAIQCKFYLPEHTLSKEDINSYVAALGKKLFTSGMIVSTTDKWGKNVEATLKDQTKPITRLRVQDLDNSPVDWSGFSLNAPDKLKLQKQRGPRPHQKAAIDDVVSGLQEADRGKLIMACGTGKTYTALCIAEEMAAGGHVLFLVPSLSLLSQTLREWTAHSRLPIHALAVCSDSNIGNRQSKDSDDADINVTDLSFPATTNTKSLLKQYAALQLKIKKRKQSKTKSGVTVVFSTYHSIQSISDAQKAGLPEFDLIICDEAHRTTGVTLQGQDESHFVKVHDQKIIKGKKRLYMTATPRLFSDEAMTRADEAGAELCSMNRVDQFGEELHRLGFGQAVTDNLLTDYKVLVLAMDEKYVHKTFQSKLTDSDNELALDDAVRIMGCWNGLAKKLEHSGSDSSEVYGDPAPMKTAVAFSRSIQNSKDFCRMFEELQEDYRSNNPDEEAKLKVELDHVDGSYNALERGKRLDWLKEPTPAMQCRVLSNARCLSEGVDVPTLDAVMFLNPRNSVVDVVQSVGRVMRKSPGKSYGYIILPIGIPAGITPEEALKDNKKYKIVWQVLQALRAHDDRFNATINHIELNKKRPEKIQVIGIGGPGGDENNKSSGDGKDKKGKNLNSSTSTFSFYDQLGEWKDAIYAKIVKKCGEREYWENWASDVAKIAQRHTDRIKLLLADGSPKHKLAFERFLQGLHENINPSISQDEAIEMLSQHLITRPVFDALFDDFRFSDMNPVSIAMQGMLDALEDQALEKETASLQKFYDSVRLRASKIDNAEGKQKVILELYDKFFATAFKKTSERLGIVYTPVQVVDFIIHSVEDLLKQEFGTSISAKDVHVIDPFTGTGTFMVRLLQSGLIKKEDLLRKYTEELHANEIVLLAYYIAAVNIEETLHALLAGNGEEADYKAKSGKAKEAKYHPFEGIVLTDTFQLTEDAKYHQTGDQKMFPENNKRVTRQKKSPIRVVITNPPYSVNDNPVPYPALDSRITDTYSARSTATNKNSLYDSYIRAIRWASDRIDGKGIVGFVTNGSFIDNNTMDGLRACLAGEFTSLYIFNLRGNQRTSGELSRQEGGKIFGSGSRTPVAISLLVKNPEKPSPAAIHYHDIGDYLSKEEKLEIISGFKSISGIHKANKWKTLKPNPQNDWINLRDPAFKKFITLSDKKNKNTFTVFEAHSGGVKTNRDAWCYGFSSTGLAARMKSMIEFYNEQVAAFSKVSVGKSKEESQILIAEYCVDAPTKINWTSGIRDDLARKRIGKYESSGIRTSMYRPFTKQVIFMSQQFNDRTYQIPKIFPTNAHSNIIITLSGLGVTKEFSALIVQDVPDVQLQANGQCFPLYLYEKVEAKAGELDLAKAGEAEGELVGGYRRKSGVTDGILKEFRAAYGQEVSKEDVFYYIYGVLHSPEYRERFSADLKKMLPRILLTKEKTDYEKFTASGRELAEWHLNYETVPPHPDTALSSDVLGLDKWELCKVQKMTHPKVNKQVDRSSIIVNPHLRVTGIPLEAYDYVVNGKSALDWIIERYQVTVDKESGIRNDPNDWCREHDNPSYIPDLIRRVAHVSTETMRIVNALPALNEKVTP